MESYIFKTDGIDFSMNNEFLNQLNVLFTPKNTLKEVKVVKNKNTLDFDLLFKIPKLNIKINFPFRTNMKIVHFIEEKIKILLSPHPFRIYLKISFFKIKKYMVLKKMKFILF